MLYCFIFSSIALLARLRGIISVVGMVQELRCAETQLSELPYPWIADGVEEGVMVEFIPSVCTEFLVLPLITVS